MSPSSRNERWSTLPRRGRPSEPVLPWFCARGLPGRERRNRCRARGPARLSSQSTAIAASLPPPEPGSAGFRAEVEQICRLRRRSSD